MVILRFNDKQIQNVQYRSIALGVGSHIHPNLSQLSWSGLDVPHHPRCAPRLPPTSKSVQSGLIFLPHVLWAQTICWLLGCGKDNLPCVVYKDLFISYNLEAILESRKDHLSGPGRLCVNLKSTEVYVSSE